MGSTPLAPPVYVLDGLKEFGSEPIEIELDGFWLFE